MLEKIKLKFCPFCGGASVRLMSSDTEDGSPYCIDSDDELGDKYCYVHCYGCDIDFMLNNDGTAREVISAWNRRVEDGCS